MILLSCFPTSIKQRPGRKRRPQIVTGIVSRGLLLCPHHIEGTGDHPFIWQYGYICGISPLHSYCIPSLDHKNMGNSKALKSDGATLAWGFVGSVTGWLWERERENSMAKWCKHDIDVSWNGGTPKSSILVAFSLINQPLWDTPNLGNPHISISQTNFLFWYVEIPWIYRMLRWCYSNCRRSPGSPWQQIKI